MRIKKLIDNNIHIMFGMAAMIFLFFVINSVWREPTLFGNETKELIKPYDIKEEVTINFSDGTSEIRKIPFVIQTDKSFTITLDLNGIGIMDNKTLSFITKNILLRCEVDDKIIYRNSSPNNNIRYEDGNLMYMIKLPTKIKNDVITIYYENDKDYITKFELKNVKIGNKINIIMDYLLREDLGSLILIFLMLAIFFGIIASANFLHEHTNIELYFNFMAIFCLEFSIYIFSQISISYFLFSRYHVIFYILSYTIPMILPMPLVCAVVKRTDSRYSLLLKLGSIFAAFNIFIQLSLVTLNKGTLTMMPIFTYIVIIYTSITIIFAILKTESTEDNPVEFMLLTLSPIFIGSYITIAINIFTHSASFTHIMKASILLFFILLCNEIFRFYMKIRDKNIKISMYKQLAYIDKLTNIGNRLAFNDKKEFYSKTTTPFYCIGLDIDGLKVVNDSLGHKYGDMLIKKLAQVLKTEFNPSYQKDLFRIGGDEFSVFYHVPKNYNIETEIENLKISYQNAFADSKIDKFGVSIGYSYFDPQNGDKLEDVLHLADQQMYNCKRKNKKRRKTDK